MSLLYYDMFAKYCLTVVKFVVVLKVELQSYVCENTFLESSQNYLKFTGFLRSYDQSVAK